MKKTLSIILLACAATGVHAQQSSSIKTSPSDKDIVIGSPDDTTANRGKIFTAVEEMPQFTGGINAFYQYLGRNIHYPISALQTHAQGKVIVGFVVEDDGTLSDVKIIRSVSPDIDAEAVRVISHSPRWIPGIQNGKQVRVAYAFAMNFTLPKPVIDSAKIFTAVENEPTFPGGEDAFISFLAKNLHYPPAARENHVQGKVFLSFIVERDGSLSDMKVSRGVSNDLDAEAIRVMKLSPKWNPGVQNGRTVRVAYTIPVTFALQASE